MTPEQVAGLRALAEALPPEAPLPVPSSWLRELLTHRSPAPQLPTPAERMLTAEEVAPLLGTTVRWVGVGHPSPYGAEVRDLCQHPARFWPVLGSAISTTYALI